MTTKNARWGRPAIAVALMIAVWTLPLSAEESGNDELTDLINDVGQFYAEGYLAPLTSGFGINQNSGLYHTAEIPVAGFKFGFAIKGMASMLGDDDKTFRVSRRVTLSDYADPGDYGNVFDMDDEGIIVLEGPTVFGAEGEAGTMTGYLYGIPVFEEAGIESLVDFDYVPLITPEISAGTAGFRGTLRWVPDVDAGDVGKISYMGFGVAYTANALIPTLPVDVMVGFFKQSLDVGDVVSTSASSMYVAVSKDFNMLTVYGGLAKESSDMDVSYEMDDGSGTIAFSLDGVQEGRATIGTTLNLGLKLNAEINMGNMTTYAGGLVIGF